MHPDDLAAPIDQCGRRDNGRLEHICDSSTRIEYNGIRHVLFADEITHDLVGSRVVDADSENFKPLRGPLLV